MKLKANTLGIILLLLVSVAFSSCKRDKCKKISCVNGICTEGNCICADGYDGTLCDQVVSEKFVGNWQCDELCSAGNDSYTIKVWRDTDDFKKLYISGLWEQNDTLVGYVGADPLLFTVSRQPLANKEVIGTGNFDVDLTTFTFTYDMYGVGSPYVFDHCVATLTLP